MTVDEGKALVKTLRRQLLLASVSRIALLALVLIGFAGAVVQKETGADTEALWYAAMLAAVVWVMMTMFSVRQVRASNQASVYIASGRLDLAEAQLRSALRQFSLYRMGKLLACHNLAVVAHGRKDYQVAAELCEGVIGLGGGISRSVGRLCRILLADCRLCLGEAGSASRALEPLALQDDRLTLAERLMLLPIELRCQAEGGQYASATESISWKVRLAELLEAPKAGLVHALLARACRQIGKAEEAAFLYRRAGLYCDLGELSQEYEILRDSAQPARSADNNPDKKP